MLKLFRLYSCLYRFGVPVLPKILYMVNRICFAIALPPSSTIGKRVSFAYQGLGVVIHARAVIGNDVYIGPQVIIGGRSGEQSVPIIGDNVVLGTGCCVLGPIKIGSGATIGAGAVVISDVPPDETWGGGPCQVDTIDAQEFICITV